VFRLVSHGYKNNLRPQDAKRNLLATWSPLQSSMSLCRSAKSTTCFGEDLLDFVIHRESANFSFREDNFAVDNYIELSGLTRLYLDLLAEAGVERRGQTGRARFVASNLAIQNLGSHFHRLARRDVRLNRYQRSSTADLVAKP
jgi:hypothetical protein